MKERTKSLVIRWMWTFSIMSGFLLLFNWIMNVDGYSLRFFISLILSALISTIFYFKSKELWGDGK